LTGDSEAPDSEFAKFQAQFVGGLPLAVVMLGTGNKARRRPKVFTIRFLPKKGLTLVWSKKDSLVLSNVTQVLLGAGPGELAGVLAAAGGGQSSPRASTGGAAVAEKGAGGQAGISSDKLFCLVFTVEAPSSHKAATPAASNAVSSLEARGRAASGVDLLAPSGGGKKEESAANEGEVTLVLESTGLKQRNELARCFRRLAQQERERLSFLA